MTGAVAPQRSLVDEVLTEHLRVTDARGWPFSGLCSADLEDAAGDAILAIYRRVVGGKPFTDAGHVRAYFHTRYDGACKDRLNSASFRALQRPPATRGDAASDDRRERAGLDLELVHPARRLTAGQAHRVDDEAELRDRWRQVEELLWALPDSRACRARPGRVSGSAAGRDRQRARALTRRDQARRRPRRPTTARGRGARRGGRMVRRGPPDDRSPPRRQRQPPGGAAGMPPPRQLSAVPPRRNRPTPARDRQTPPHRKLMLQRDQTNLFERDDAADADATLTLAEPPDTPRPSSNEREPLEPAGSSVSTVGCARATAPARDRRRGGGGRRGRRPTRRARGRSRSARDREHLAEHCWRASWRRRARREPTRCRSRRRRDRQATSDRATPGGSGPRPPTGGRARRAAPCPRRQAAAPENAARGAPAGGRPASGLRQACAPPVVDAVGAPNCRATEPTGVLGRLGRRPQRRRTGGHDLRQRRV